MLIKMTSTHRMSPDGFKVIPYEAGKVYDLNDMTAWHAIKIGWAVKAYEVEVAA